MLDFGQVQARGMHRAMTVAQGGDPPPHTFIIEPLVQQLMGPDYCADNGAMLTPHEAQGMGSVLSQMANVMDHLEHEKIQAVAHSEAGLEMVQEMAEQLARYQLIQRWVLIAAGVGAILGSQVLIAMWVG